MILRGADAVSLRFLFGFFIRRDDWGKYLLPLDGSEVAKRDLLGDCWLRDGHTYAISSGQRSTNRPVFCNGTTARFIWTQSAAILFIISSLF